MPTSSTRTSAWSALARGSQEDLHLHQLSRHPFGRRDPERSGLVALVVDLLIAITNNRNGDKEILWQPLVGLEEKRHLGMGNRAVELLPGTRS